jgi:ubiquinone/menaquinone biosynthesis C-methylase UbiE
MQSRNLKKGEWDMQHKLLFNEKFSSKKIWESNWGGGDVVSVPYTEIFSTILQNYDADSLKGKKLLEIGCGSGNNLLFAGLHLGLEVYGLDFSKSAVNYTKNLLNQFGVSHSVEVADASSLEYPECTFDIIIDRAAIQHNQWEKCNAIVSEVKRVLKKQGLFVLNVTSEHHPRFADGEQLGDGSFFCDEEFGVRHFFSKYQIIQLLRSFQILKWETLNRFDNISGQSLGSIYHIAAST